MLHELSGRSGECVLPLLLRILGLNMHDRVPPSYLHGRQITQYLLEETLVRFPVLSFVFCAVSPALWLSS
jgi:hypothetical protein